MESLPDVLITRNSSLISFGPLVQIPWRFAVDPFSQEIYSRHTRHESTGMRQSVALLLSPTLHRSPPASPFSMDSESNRSLMHHQPQAKSAVSSCSQQQQQQEEESTSLSSKPMSIQKQLQQQCYQAHVRAVHDKLKTGQVKSFT